jgi:hypothetical protein
MGIAAEVTPAVSRELKDALLTGTLDKLAPVIRLGPHRYIRYDKILISQDGILFMYENKVMVTINVRAGPGDTITIDGLEGRLKMEIT